MRLLSLAKSCLAMLCLSTLAAHADTLTTFGIFGDFNVHTQSFDGGPYDVRGQVTINTTLGTVESFDLHQPLVPGFFDQSLPVGDKVVLGSAYPTIAEFWLQEPNFYNAQSLQLTLNTSTLVGYTGGDLCSLSVTCNMPGQTYGPTSTAGMYRSVFTLNDGGLYAISSVETSPTPEPSSLALLGTGALGVMGVIRRRIAA